jgi:glycerol kinase
MGTAALLAIDQGTSSTRAIAFSIDGEPLALEQQPFEQLFPASGWVEHDPELIWATVLSSVRAVLERLRGLERSVVAIGITNQRETVVAWDRRDGRPLHNAIVWQDRRTAEECRRLAQAGHEKGVIERTGLRLDPYFSATKLNWLLRHVPEVRAAAQAGHLAFGTIDSFLLWRLSGGRVHLTDASNASRTALYDIGRGCWDESLCALFEVPLAALPEVRDSAGDFDHTDPALLGESFPIRGVAGDQQAALLGQACLAEGDAKSTYGTGAFMVLNTGTQRVRSGQRLLSTIAWRLAGRITYALEGSILSAGATIQWLRDGLGLITRASESEALAASVADTGGAYLVPAFTGLGAPYWDPEARAALVGLSRASGRAEIVRAALDSVAYQSAELLQAMAADGVTPARLKVDGGMAVNRFLMQRLADLTGLPILRPRLNEATAWGAAALAALGSGLYGSLEELTRVWQLSERFEPQLDVGARERELAGWRAAVQRARGAVR